MILSINLFLKDFVNAALTVNHLSMAYGDYTVMRDLHFEVHPGEIFLIIGGSGCGKSTLLKYLIGIEKAPDHKIFYGSIDINTLTNSENIARKFGVLYQSGALWGDLTIAENIALPLTYYTNLSKKTIAELVAFKLSLVGLGGFEDFYPFEISGGMKKRAGLARAMILDPEFLFFDEPSAGLDPISSKRLDDLILEIRNCFGTTIIVVTHELASVFAIGDRAIYLDAKTKTALAIGTPQWLLHHSDPKVRYFLSRGNICE
ncbi:MAG: ATP-binding cassette domain-containing protein [Puniceicoccales bacterium]|jgi:phospholipid/cholesterol/gamma-HCH transport system ATP-binding protein|nr:ATP-binding cassette domain-containing protein [Puniceicoccales bacterium]